MLGISWDEAARVMEKAVQRGRKRKQARPLAQIGVDEKAFKKGHSYVTVVSVWTRFVWKSTAGCRRRATTR